MQSPSPWTHALLHAAACTIFTVILLGAPARAQTASKMPDAGQDPGEATALEGVEALARGREAIDAMDFALARKFLTKASKQLRASDLRLHREDLLSALGLLAAALLFSDDEPEAKNTLRALLTFDPEWNYPLGRRTPELAALLETVRAEMLALDRAPLLLRSTPEGAEVVVDGEALGKTPLTTPLLPGRHVLALSSPGFLPRQEEIFVSPGLKVSWVLSKDPRSVAALTPEDNASFLSRHRAALAFGGAALGAGLTTLFALEAQAATRGAQSSPQTDLGGYQAFARQANRRALAANIFFYATLASAALGGTFLILDRGHAGQAVAQIVVAPGGAAVVLGGRF